MEVEEQASGQVSETEDEAEDEAEGEEKIDAPRASGEICKPPSIPPPLKHQSAKPTRQRAIGEMGVPTDTSNFI